MRAIIWLVYGAVLALLFTCSQQRYHPGGYAEATATLEANRRLEDGDVRLGGGPLYLRHRVERGGRIDAADVAPWPWLSLPADRVAIGLPIRGPGPWRPGVQGVRPLNVGDIAVACPAVPGLTGTLSVLAVPCGPAGAQCLAVVAATPDQAVAIAAKRRGTPGLAFARTCQ